MSLLLASMAAMAGTTFRCEVDSAYFTLFAPAAEETANYRGNVLTLYSIEGDGELLPPPYKFEEIFDDLPYALFTEVSAGEGLNLLINIEPGEADTADLSITGTQDGQSTDLAGTCTFAHSDGKEGE